MKIGIITFCKSKDNYGQILQCFALQRFLIKLGHNPFLIKYEPCLDTMTTNYLFKIRGILSHPISFIKNRIKKRNNLRYEKTANFKQRNFESFINENIISEGPFNRDQLYNNPPHADCYVCGSDQIWGRDDIYYISFVKGVKKIAYAPSIAGLARFSEQDYSRIRNLVQNYYYIGVRETSGIEFCKHLGIDNANIVEDPTLLLKKEDYVSIEKPPIESNYIFLYLLGNPIDFNIQKVFDYAKKKNKKVIYVASQGRVDSYEKQYPTIQEWLGYIHKADVVITNSFHGTVLSLIYGTPFVSIKLKQSHEKMNLRIEELLERCNLSHRIYVDCFIGIMESDFNTSSFLNVQEHGIQKATSIFSM